MKNENEKTVESMTVREFIHYFKGVESALRGDIIEMVNAFVQTFVVFRDLTNEQEQFPEFSREVTLEEMNEFRKKYSDVYGSVQFEINGVYYYNQIETATTASDYTIKDTQTYLHLHNKLRALSIEQTMSLKEVIQKFFIEKQICSSIEMLQDLKDLKCSLVSDREREEINSECIFYYTGDMFFNWLDSSISGDEKFYKEVYRISSTYKDLTIVDQLNKSLYEILFVTNLFDVVMKLHRML